MWRAYFRLGWVLVLIVLVLGLPLAAAAGPTLTLNPTSGNPSTVSGGLGGSGWLCSSGGAPTGGATVSGTGASGSAMVNRDGSLTGSFTVRGIAGERIEVKVTANTSCPSAGPPIYLQAAGYFAFNPPTPLPTATTRPTSTRMPTLTPPPTSTPVPVATLVPTAPPRPTVAVEPTSAPEPTTPPRPTAVPEPTAEPEPTVLPEPTLEPEPTSAPAFTATPRSLPAPTATATAMSSPAELRATIVSATPSASAEPAATSTAAPMPTATATPPARPANGQGSLLFVGCVPSASQVQVEFLPLGMLAAGETVSGATSGPSVRVATTAAQDVPGKLAFQPPASAEAGRIYRVSAMVDDPQCSVDPKSASQFWLAGAGNDVRIPVMPLGAVALEVSNNGDQPPIPQAMVKGAFMESGRPAEYAGAEIDPPSQFDGWETQIDFYGSVEGRKQRFRWSTDLATAGSAVLQVSMLPFPKGYEANPFSPAGMLASWPVDCVKCEFVVDLSPLPAPEAKEVPETSVATAQASDSLLDKLGQLITAASDTIGSALGNLFGNVSKAVAGLFGGSKEPTPKPALKVAEIEVPSGKVTKAGAASLNLGGNSAANPVNPLVFTTFYFRVLPLKEGIPVGNGSNAVIMHWAGATVPTMTEPDLSVKPTATPTPSAYGVEIVSYHGVLPPQDCKNWGGYSYVVTQDAWLDKSSSMLTYTTKPNPFVAPTYKKGDLLCEPEPKEPSSFEKMVDKIGDWVSGAWNWVSEAYSDLKAFAVDVILDFTPLGLQCKAIASQAGGAGICEKIFATGLDAAMVTMGIPPDLPNLDQLMDQGIDYVAGYMTEQAMAQVGVPPELTEGLTGVALEQAKQKFKEEMQSQIKQGLAEGVTQMQLSYAKSAGWLPKGVPVRPNDYQPAGMSLKVTRKFGVPGGEAGCSVNVSDVLTIDQSKLDNVPPGYVNGFTELNKKHALSAYKNYDLFVDLKLPVPPLAPGSSVTIPMSFKPNAYNSGWSPWGSVETTDYFKAWGYMHMLGDLQLFVNGCGSAKLAVPASGSYGPSQP